uniref:Uncharacterized protein n=2 Tax=Avena sativa TaxID=4498 RepID=A0ACD5YIQ9_AVESA
MSFPCSDQDYRLRNMKDAILPPGVEHLGCWCGTLCKVKESTDFSDKMGMKFFMCPNYQYDPAPWSYNRPPLCFIYNKMIYFLFYGIFTMFLFVMQSPPPLCIWYRWIDTEQPEWALREIEERSRRAWQNFHEDERREKEAEKHRAAQQEQRRRLEELRR